TLEKFQAEIPEPCRAEITSVRFTSKPDWTRTANTIWSGRTFVLREAVTVTELESDWAKAIEIDTANITSRRFNMASVYVLRCDQDRRGILPYARMVGCTLCAL